MARTVSATQAKVKFGEILSDVSVGKEHVEIEKQGRKVAAMIPREDYELFMKLRETEKRLSRQEVLDRIIEWRDRLPPPDPDAPTAVEIIRELRQKARF